MNPQSIEMKGYLYRDSEGRVVLADTPNLKSCCLGKASKVYLTGSFPEELPAQMAMVRGSLVGDGLVEAEIVSAAGSGGIVVVGILVVAVIAWFLRRRPQGA